MLDDLLELRTGDQIPCDGVVRTADGLEVDESLLTGESDPINKADGDDVLSGSFVVAGSGRFQATRVGRRLVRGQARHRGPPVPAHPLRADGRHQHDPARSSPGCSSPCRPCCCGASCATTSSTSALRFTVAGVVGMVPEGLVLLTSIAFGVAAVTLARRQGPGAGAARGRRPGPRRRRLPRQDGHPHRGRDRVRRGRAGRGQRRRRGGGGARRAGRRREPQRHRWSRSPRAFASPRWTRTGGGAVLLGAEVERGHVRRAGVVGDGRPRDGVRRRGVAGAGAGRRAGLRRAPHPGAGAQRRRAGG